jgi:hypothetical protein
MVEKVRSYVREQLTKRYTTTAHDEAMIITPHEIMQVIHANPDKVVVAFRKFSSTYSGAAMASSRLGVYIPKPYTIAYRDDDTLLVEIRPYDEPELVTAIIDLAVRRSTDVDLNDFFRVELSAEMLRAYKSLSLLEKQGVEARVMYLLGEARLPPVKSASFPGRLELQRER